MDAQRVPSRFHNNDMQDHLVRMGRQLAEIEAQHQQFIVGKQPDRENLAKATARYLNGLNRVSLDSPDHDQGEDTWHVPRLRVSSESNLAGTGGAAVPLGARQLLVSEQSDPVVSPGPGEAGRQLRKMRSASAGGTGRSPPGSSARSGEPPHRAHEPWAPSPSAAAAAARRQAILQAYASRAAGPPAAARAPRAQGLRTSSSAPRPSSSSRSPSARPTPSPSSASSRTPPSPSPWPSAQLPRARAGTYTPPAPAAARRLPAAAAAGAAGADVIRVHSFHGRQFHDPDTDEEEECGGAAVDEEVHAHAHGGGGPGLHGGGCSSSEEAESVSSEDVFETADALTSFHLPQLQRSIELLPDITHGWLIQEITQPILEDAAHAGVRQICPRVDACTRELVAQARAAGFTSVRGWGVKSKELLRHAAACRMHGATVNWPHEAKAVL